MLRSYTPADALTIGNAACGTIAILIVLVLGLASYMGRIDDRLWLGAVQLGPAELHPLVLIYGISGSAMISATLRIPKP